MELLGRALERVGATLKVVATVGLLLIVLGVGELWYGNNEVNFPPFLPTSTVPILGVNVGWDQITVTIISLDRHRGPLLVLPVRAHGLRHARRRRQPRPSVDDGREPHTRAALGLDHLHDLLLHGRPLAGARSQPERRHHLDPRRLRVRGCGDRRLLEPAAHLPRWTARRHRRVPGHEVLGLDHVAERPAAGDPLHRPLPGPVRHAQGEAGRAPGRDHAPGQEVLVRAVAGSGRHVRDRARRPVPDPEPGGGRSGHLGQLPGRRHPVAVAGTPRARVGTDLAVPPRVRSGRCGLLRALHRQLPPAMAAGAAAGHAGRPARGSDRGDPGHPAVGTVPRPGDAGLRDSAPVSLLFDESHVRTDDIGDTGATTGRQHLRPLARVGQGVLLRAAGRGGAQHRGHHGDPAQPPGSAPGRAGGLAAGARDAGGHDQCDQGPRLLPLGRVRRASPAP